MSIWLGMIILHAVFAVMCFVSGSLLMSPQKAKEQPRLINVFVVSLVGMIIFMVAATICHWSDLSITERVAFSGLPLLGDYMLYRTFKAIKELRNNHFAQYIHGIGFSLISLFNGFVIVALIDLGARPIFIPIAAIFGTVIGTKFVSRIKGKQLNAGAQ